MVIINVASVVIKKTSINILLNPSTESTDKIKGTRASIGNMSERTKYTVPFFSESKSAVTTTNAARSQTSPAPGLRKFNDMTAPDIEKRKTENIDKICSLGFKLVLLRLTISNNTKNAVANTTPSKFTNIAAFWESADNAKVTKVLMVEMATIIGSNGKPVILFEIFSMIILVIVLTEFILSKYYRKRSVNI